MVYSLQAACLCDNYFGITPGYLKLFPTLHAYLLTSVLTRSISLPCKGVGTAPQNYFQKHVSPSPPLFGPSSQSYTHTHTHTEIHTSIREATQPSCKIILCGVASPVHHNCTV